MKTDSNKNRKGNKIIMNNLEEEKSKGKIVMSSTTVQGGMYTQFHRNIKQSKEMRGLSMSSMGIESLSC